MFVSIPEWNIKEEIMTYKTYVQICKMWGKNPVAPQTLEWCAEMESKEWLEYRPVINGLLKKVLPRETVNLYTQGGDCV